MKAMPSREGYPFELHLAKADDLFVDPDTDPLQNPRLGISGIQTVLDELCARKLDRPVHLIVYLPGDQIAPGLEDRIWDATRRYCEFQSQVNERESENTRRTGRRAFRYGLIGMAVFLGLAGLCYFVVNNAGNNLVRSIAAILATFFSVASWVIVWGPVDTLMYGWRPFRRQARLYQAIANAQVTVRTEP